MLQTCMTKQLTLIIDENFVDITSRSIRESIKKFFLLHKTATIKLVDVESLDTGPWKKLLVKDTFLLLKVSMTNVVIQEVTINQDGSFFWGKWKFEGNGELFHAEDVRYNFAGNHFSFPVEMRFKNEPVRDLEIPVNDCTAVIDYGTTRSRIFVSKLSNLG